MKKMFQAMSSFAVFINLFIYTMFEIQLRNGLTNFVLGFCKLYDNKIMKYTLFKTIKLNSKHVENCLY